MKLDVSVFFYIFSTFLGATTGSIQGLLLAPCSEVTLGRAKGTIWDARDQTLVNHMQGPTNVCLAGPQVTTKYVRPWSNKIYFTLILHSQPAEERGGLRPPTLRAGRIIMMASGNPRDAGVLGRESYAQ